MKGGPGSLVVLAATAGAVTCLLLAQMIEMPVRLVYNASASAPLGFYLVLEPKPPRRGALVLARLPRSWQTWAAGRGYLGEDVPLIKHVAALEGDHVCMRGRHLLVNGLVRAVALKRDREGRALPPWHGCRHLGPGEVLLLGDEAPGSLDSRYFGPLSVDDVIGRLRPLARCRRGDRQAAATGE